MLLNSGIVLVIAVFILSVQGCEFVRPKDPPPRGVICQERGTFANPVYLAQYPNRRASACRTHCFFNSNCTGFSYLRSSRRGCNLYQAPFSDMGFEHDSNAAQVVSQSSCSECLEQNCTVHQRMLKNGDFNAPHLAPWNFSSLGEFEQSYTTGPDGSPAFQTTLQPDAQTRIHGAELFQGFRECENLNRYNLSFDSRFTYAKGGASIVVSTFNTYTTFDADPQYANRWQTNSFIVVPHEPYYIYGYLLFYFYDTNSSTTTNETFAIDNVKLIALRT